MKNCPPKIPDLFKNIYNLDKKNIINNSNTKAFGKLNKETIPIVFYNHLMMNENYKKFSKNKNYFKSSITQRNKKKLLTILYYSPKV